MNNEITLSLLSVFVKGEIQRMKDERISPCDDCPGYGPVSQTISRNQQKTRRRKNP